MASYIAVCHEFNRFSRRDLHWRMSSDRTAAGPPASRWLSRLCRMLASSRAASLEYRYDSFSKMNCFLARVSVRLSQLVGGFISKIIAQGLCRTTRATNHCSPDMSSKYGCRTTSSEFFGAIESFALLHSIHAPTRFNGVTARVGESPLVRRWAS